jgi:hypothetical protein
VQDIHWSMLFKVQSVLIISLMYFGAYIHAQRSLHVKIMSTAIIWDILLILQIELTRSAINTATKALTNTAVLNFHISIAVISVILYGFLFKTGRQILKGDNSVLPYHKKLAYTCLTLRTLVVITSYFTKA